MSKKNVNNIIEKNVNNISEEKQILKECLKEYQEAKKFKYNNYNLIVYNDNN